MIIHSSSVDVDCFPEHLPLSFRAKCLGIPDLPVDRHDRFDEWVALFRGTEGVEGGKAEDVGMAEQPGNSSAGDRILSISSLTSWETIKLTHLESSLCSLSFPVLLKSRMPIHLEIVAYSMTFVCIV